MKNSSTKKESRFLGEIVILLITLLWGSTFVIVKQSLNDISSMLYVAIRFSLAAVVLLPIFLLKWDKKKKFIIWPGVFLGIWLFLGFTVQTMGLGLTTATKSGFITGIFVVLIPFFQIFIEKKKPSKGIVTGICLVFLGLVFLFSGGNSVFEFFSLIGNDLNFGDFLTFLCAIFFAVHVVYIDKLSKENSLLSLLFSQLITVSVLSFIFTGIFSITSIEQIKAEFSGYAIFSLLFTAIIATLMNIGLQTKFQKSVSPSKAGIIYSFEPLFAALLAYIVLNEKIGKFGYIGSALIFSGLIVSEIYDNLFNKDGKESA